MLKVSGYITYSSFFVFLINYILQVDYKPTADNGRRLTFCGVVCRGAQWEGVATCEAS